MEDLSKRELEILRRLPMENYDIANELNISYSTVRTHVRRIYEKLEVQSKIECALKALKLGIVHLNEFKK